MDFDDETLAKVAQKMTEKVMDRSKKEGFLSSLPFTTYGDEPEEPDPTPETTDGPMTKLERKKDGMRANEIADILSKVLTDISRLKPFEHLKDQRIYMAPGKDKVRMKHKDGRSRVSVLKCNFEEFINNLRSSAERSKSSPGVQTFRAKHEMNVSNVEKMGENIRDESVRISFRYKEGPDRFSTIVSQESLPDETKNLKQKVGNGEEDDEDFLSDLDLIE